MPPICIHLSIAREAAELLRHPVIDQNLGSYLFGSTLPDVHIVTGGSREETHFFDLEGESSVSGARLIFEVHPTLANGERLDWATRSLVAGYLSHLVTDEAWVLDIYRPCFGSYSLLSQEPMANMLDRALQYELDRREREDRGKMEEIRAQISRWEPRQGFALIDAPALKQWAEFVLSATSREPSLDLFPFFARRFLLTRQKVDPQQLEQFLSVLPAKLEWAIQYVTAKRIAAFREKAVADSVAVTKEYLGEDN